MRYVAAAVVALVLGSGCGPAATEQETARNEELLSAIASELSQASDVEAVEASYVDNVESQAIVYIRVDCRGCDRADTFDEVVRAIWGSEVTPLLGMSVRVVDASSKRERSEVLSVLNDEDRLTDEYGERPVPSRPDDG